MKKFGLIGKKLSHSYSPRIHGLIGDYDYGLYEVPEEGLADFLRENDLDGFNVTVPYKEAVLPFCSELSDRARAVGSVNTMVKLADGTYFGDNTDYCGFEALLDESAKCIVQSADEVETRRERVSSDGPSGGPGGKATMHGLTGKALVLGSGGASKAVCAVLRDRDIEHHIVSRNGCLNYENAALIHGDASIIINTTPVGMYPGNGKSPLDLTQFPEVKVVIDLIYNPYRTALMLQAGKLGIKAYGGLTMLVAQAIEASKVFLGMTGAPAEPRPAEAKATTQPAESKAPTRPAEAKVPTQLEESTGLSEVTASPAEPRPSEVKAPTQLEEIRETILAETLNIALIGMPGSGKTTYGREIAGKTGRPFVDLDDEIEKASGKTIAEIFAEGGESLFRIIETRVLSDFSKRSGLVIATGGGIVTVEENRDLLRQNSKILFVDCPLDLLETKGRPLSETVGVEKLWEERRDLYHSLADEII